MDVIALANQNGGVGKTTTSATLGAALAQKGKRVLLVDLDQQGNLGISAGIAEPDEIEPTIYNVLATHASTYQGQTRVTLADILLHIDSLGVDLIPANIDLAAVDLELINAMNREYLLRRVLEPIKGKYDYVLLDCPPSLGFMVVNALAAANKVIIPLQAQYLATRGVRQLLRTISVAQQELNPGLKIEGILLTMVAPTTHSKEVVSLTRSKFDGKVPVFDSVIKTSVRVQEAPIGGQSILTYEPKSDVAQAYLKLADEVISNA